MEPWICGELEILARVLTDLENSGKMVLVSSGAIGAGMNRMKLTELTKNAQTETGRGPVGQGLLMRVYHKFF